MNRASRFSLIPHKGFTLIELLVVIGIILITAGRFLPPFARAYRWSGALSAATTLNSWLWYVLA
ncbi:MAG: type II secretion system GspH family protein [Candidatus Omnitrophica bacterium]|nr:type II secretion system GspH family protein [Candidatus Omnitrophota bacterium]